MVLEPPQKPLLDLLAFFIAGLDLSFALMLNPLLLHRLIW